MLFTGCSWLSTYQPCARAVPPPPLVIGWGHVTTSGQWVMSPDFKCHFQSRTFHCEDIQSSPFFLLEQPEMFRWWLLWPLGSQREGHMAQDLQSINSGYVVWERNKLCYFKHWGLETVWYSSLSKTILSDTCFLKNKFSWSNESKTSSVQDFPSRCYIHCDSPTRGYRCNIFLTYWWSVEQNWKPAIPTQKHTFDQDSLAGLSTRSQGSVR